MAEFIIVVVIAVICVLAVVLYAKKLRQGCCGGVSDKERVVVSSDEDITSYCIKYSIEVGGMTCSKCAQRIQNAFNRQEGCLSRVSYRENSAEVFTKQKMPELLLRKTIVDLGYTAGNIKSESLDNM